MLAGGIHHIAVATEDPERLADFYQRVLGLSALGVNRENGSVRSVWIRLGESILMLERASISDPGGPRSMDEKRSGLHLLALAIPAGERAGWVSRLKNAGVTIEQTSSYSIYFRDSDGNLLALSHYPEAIS